MGGTILRAASRPASGPARPVGPADGPDRPVRHRKVRPRPVRTSIGTSWRAIGTPGRVVTLAALIAAFAVAVAWPATGAAVAVLVLAALVDGVEHRLPNPLVAAALVPVTAAVLAAALGGDPAPVVAALAGASIVGVPLLATHLVTPVGMGFGDVKAGVVLGAALGLVGGDVALLALVIGLGTAATWGLVRRARSVPLGPGLVAGALAALALQAGALT